MTTRDYRDVIGGALLIGFGLFVSLYATANYDLGTLNSMGPGLFPAALGYVLAGTGVIIVLPALFRPGVRPEIEVRPLLALLASTAVFAITVERFGLVPAVVLLTLFAGLARDRFAAGRMLALAVFLATISVLLFVVGLRIQISAFRWPF